jgi:hypothetical protein
MPATLRPWDEPDSLLAAAGGLRGATLARVAYLYPATREDPWPYEGDAAEEIDMGVELTAADGRRFRAVWYMRSFDQGLVLAPAAAVPPATMELAAVDVSDSERWRPLIGREVTDVELYWHVPEDRARRSVWAARLAFAEGGAVTLALGRTLEADPVDYQPDAIVAIFDDELARAYVDR